MLTKLSVFAIIVAAAHCQAGHGHTYSLKTIITHDVPKKVEGYHHDEIAHKVVPVHVVQSNPTHQAVPTYTEVKTTVAPAISKALFEPLIPVPFPKSPRKIPAPVHEIIIADVTPRPVSHVPVQIQLRPTAVLLPKFPYQQVYAPVQHVHTPVQSAQVQHVQVQHVPAQKVEIAQVPIHKIEVQHASAPVQKVEVHHTPVQIPIRKIEVEHFPVHHVQSKPLEVLHTPVQHVVQEISHHEEPHQSHEATQHGHTHYEDYYAYPKYVFEYKVDDPHTHDNKYQHESRDGDVVKGIYSLHEPDGSIRTVEYSSDKKAGFNAYVKNSGVTKHIAPHHYHH